MRASFGILGGDKRQLYLAKSIQDDGYDIYICGFELSSETEGLEEVSLDFLINNCDNIILPLPCTRDSESIFAPYSCREIRVTNDLINSLKNKYIYGGYMDKLINENNLWKNIKVGDYYLREELAISNAVPTAEGAIALAISEHPSILNGSKCLVTGYGRIGKVLTKNLLALGANVTVAARKSKDLAMIRAMGAKPILYKNIKHKYDIIFNTVPELVITSNIIVKQDIESIIIELASLPGGIDRKSAAINGIRVIDAQSIPGKVAPKAAGEFVKEAIYNMIEEG